MLRYSILIIIACKDSGGLDLSYPLFQVTNVAINSTEAITVDVEFSHVGSDEILRHGFVWDWVRSPALGTFQPVAVSRL